MLFCAAVLPAAASARTALEVVERDGVLSVTRDGRTVVSSVAVDRGDVGSDDVKGSFAEQPDGTKVWNRWSEVRDRRFRLEVAKRADGAVEITLAGQMEPESACRKRHLDLHLDGEAFRGRDFEALEDSGRVFRPRTGRFDGTLRSHGARWLAVDGLTFDFNPLGPGDAFADTKPGEGWAHVDAVRGYATLSAERDGWRIRTGDEVKSSYGGYVGGKIVIREGTFDDYGRHHLIRAFHYSDELTPVRLLAFGSPIRGPDYSEGNVRFAPSRGYGWATDLSHGNGQRRPAVGNREGAYYSAITCTGDDVYRFDGLTDGYYLFTYAGGNYTGLSNRFSVDVGDVRLVADGSVPTGKVRTVTRAVHVSGGRLEVRFSGTWLVSVLALQPMLADGEDFSVGRGFWVSRGYEPGVIFRSSDWTPFTPGVSDELQDLPVPGTEFAAAPREPPAPVELPDPAAPELAWTRCARIHRFFNNSSTLSELDDAAERERYIDRELAGKNANAVMVSGLLSRHTQPARRNATVESVGRIAESLHRRGIRVFDHIDATLLWNCGFGFRIMMERPGELLRTWNDNLPSYQFCVSNPDWRETFYAHLRKVLAKGIDALQVDELYHWRRGCTCRHCRERFFRETGWQVPLNECDPAWGDPLSPFRRRWRDWRIRNCTNWFVELRRRNRDIAPHLVLSAYCTPGGFVSSADGDIGQDLLDLSRAINFFGIEVMSRSVMRSSLAEVPFRRAQNILTFAYGAPVWDWYYNFNWPSDYTAWAMSEMMRQSPMLSEVPRDAGTPDYAGFDVTRGAMVREGAEPVAETAVLFSTHTRDLNVVREWQPSLFGLAQALEALHVPYEFVPDEGLTVERLKKYKVLFLSGFDRLTAADRAVLDGFRKAGGRIVDGVEGAAGFCQPELVSSPARIGKEVFRYDPDPVTEADFRKRVAAAVGDAAWWRIEAPDRVMTSVWREKSGALAIHLLNLTGVRNKVGEVLDSSAPDPAFPPMDADIVLTVPFRDIGPAAAVSPDFDGERNLETRPAPDGGMTVVLPKELFKTYTLIRLK